MSSILSQIILALCLLLNLVSAANTVKILNHCPHSLYFWVVGPRQDVPDSASIMVPGYGGSVIHGMVDTTDQVGGISMKIRDLPHYAVAPSGILQAEYKFEPATHSIWYDFSVIDCDKGAGPENPYYCPFILGGVKMYVPGAHCPTASCTHGAGCQRTYLEHGSWYGEPTHWCNAGQDIFLETCTDGPAPRTVGSEEDLPWTPPPPPPPPPPPSSDWPVEQPHQEPPECEAEPPRGPWEAETWQTPEGMPPGTLCHNADCTCYSTSSPQLWPEYYPPNTPSCPWDDTHSEEDTQAEESRPLPYEGPCVAAGNCFGGEPLDVPRPGDFWKRRMMRIHHAANDSRT